MKIAIIGTDLSALLCAWYLRNIADVTIINTDQTIAGFCPSYSMRNGHDRVFLDHLLFAFERCVSPNTTRLLHQLGLDTHTYAVGCDFSVDGNSQSANYISAPDHHSYIFTDNYRHWRPSVSMQPLVDLSHNLLSTQIGIARALLDPFFCPNIQPCHSYLARCADIFGSQWDTYQPMPSSDRAYTYLPSSKRLTHQLLQRSKASMLLSQVITHIDVAHNHKPHRIYLGNSGSLVVDRIIVSDASSSAALNACNIPAFKHFQTIKLQSCESILHNWPGILASTNRTHKQVQYHRWTSSLGVSYILDDWLGYSNPLYLSHNVAFDIPKSSILDKKNIYLPTYDSRTQDAQKTLASMQGQSGLWFSGSRCHGADVESLVAQAATLCQTLGADTGLPVL